MPLRNTFSGVFTLESAIAIGVFVTVVGLMVVAMIRSRRRVRASQRSEWSSLETSYVAVLVLMWVFLVWVSLSANAREHDPPARPAMAVKVTGFQWCWRFTYPSAHVSVSASCLGGSDGHNLPTLVVPTGRPIKIEVTSADVIHEFSVPYLRYRVEAMPDHVNTFVFTLTRTGRWLGRCSEFCGLYHDDMDFYLQAVSPGTYERWLDHHRTTA